MPKISKMQQRLAVPAEQRKPNVSYTPKEGSVLSEREVPVNNFWDEAEHLFQTSMRGIEKSNLELAQGLASIAADQELLAKIPDHQTLINNIDLLGRDIATHTSRLHAIHQRHMGKTGGTKTPDDHSLVIQLHGMYVDALDVYNDTIMPVVADILQQVGVIDTLLAEEALRKQQAKTAAAQDVNTVSDVEVKDAAPKAE